MASAGESYGADHQPGALWSCIAHHFGMPLELVGVSVFFLDWEASF